MKEKMQDLTEEEEKGRALVVVGDLLKTYFDELQSEAYLCRNEAIRALERYVETKEARFRINNESMAIQGFLKALLLIMRFDIPSLMLSFDPRENAPRLFEKIDILLDFLRRIPGAREFKALDGYRELRSRYYSK